MAISRICYLSVDALLSPARLATAASFNPNANVLALANAGLHLRLGRIVAYTTTGLNVIYSRISDSGSPLTLSGTNLRAGAGLRFGWWGVNLSGTVLFESGEVMKQTVTDLIRDDRRDLIVASVVERTLPAVNLVIYF